MNTTFFDNNWNISDVGLVNETVFNGISANKTSKYVGGVARSAARILMGPSTSTNYKLATYLFCDFSFDMTMSSNLNVFIAGNNYNPIDYGVAVQTFSLFTRPGE